MNGPSDDPGACELCGLKLRPQEHYLVRVEVLADPSPPVVTAEQMANLDLDQTMADLIGQMEHLTADDLMDQVHRRFEYRICPGCQPEFLANPMGKPRSVRDAEN